ncbi:class I SAM-dependent methyltransferase [Streptomyces sp. NBC_01304]|uniref:class I SAM-dependent methyltransferase n=1 Tax=Streptomyces sp. NBC_01304 TaxID=2903818 RepID=UPI002E14C935|nr:class I SAM-dependent methyltransferase [Streptomyces sp. NBC_01304]
MIPNRLLEHYEDKYAAEEVAPAPPAYPLDVRRPRHRAGNAVANLARLLPPGADVLELAAGNGQIGESLRAGGVPFGSYTLSEISPPRLAGLRRAFTDPRFEVAYADAERPSEKLSGKYDAVVMLALIEHLIDPMGAMRDIASLLKPGGFVYVDTPNIAKWTRRLRLAGGRFPSTASVDEGLTRGDGVPADLHDEGHLHYFTYRSLSLMLTERCGYASTEFHPYYEAPRYFGDRLGTALSRWRPGFFAEISMVARVKDA